MTRFFLSLFVMALLTVPAFAKRAAPSPVEPFVYQGIRYIAPNDDGRRAYIEAWDVQANKKLWDSRVFTNHVDPKLEEDVQCVYIKMMTVRDRKLIVTSELGKTYQVDLKTKFVTQSVWSIKSLQATRDGRSGSASRFTLVGPACLSWTLGVITPL